MGLALLMAFLFLFFSVMLALTTVFSIFLLDRVTFLTSSIFSPKLKFHTELIKKGKLEAQADVSLEKQNKISRYMIADVIITGMRVENYPHMHPKRK